MEMKSVWLVLLYCGGGDGGQGGGGARSRLQPVHPAVHNVFAGHLLSSFPGAALWESARRGQRTGGHRGDHWACVPH